MNALHAYVACALLSVASGKDSSLEIPSELSMVQVVACFAFFTELFLCHPHSQQLPQRRGGGRARQAQGDGGRLGGVQLPPRVPQRRPHPLHHALEQGGECCYASLWRPGMAQKDFVSSSPAPNTSRDWRSMGPALPERPIGGGRTSTWQGLQGGHCVFWPVFLHPPSCVAHPMRSQCCIPQRRCDCATVQDD